MIWILLEALIALALVVGVIIWIALPQKNKRGTIKNGTALTKPPTKREEREVDGFR